MRILSAAHNTFFDIYENEKKKYEMLGYSIHTPNSKKSEQRKTIRTTKATYESIQGQANERAKE